jgi:hypothetical protein
MFTYVLYGLAFGLLGVSFFKDRSKTRMALKKAWKSFEIFYRKCWASSS